jgi:hypothetical protein
MGVLSEVKRFIFLLKSFLQTDSCRRSFEVIYPVQVNLISNHGSSIAV